MYIFCKQEYFAWLIDESSYVKTFPLVDSWLEEGNKKRNYLV